MFNAALLCLALLAVSPAWSQAGADDPGTNNNPQNDSRMQTPPPISGETYSTTPASELQSNYVRAGLIFNTIHTDNLLGGAVAMPVSGLIYSVWPSIELHHATSTWDSLFTYSPGFTFYNGANIPDETEQNAGVNIRWRLTPHLTATVHDSFQKTSNEYNQPDLVSGSAVSPTPQAPNLIPAVADQLRNTANVELTYQFSPNGMVGAGGQFNYLHFPDPAEVPGLYDSNSRSGSAFYSRRLTEKQYMGALYQYSGILEYPVGPQVETETHTVSLFYTVYLKRTLSFSLSGGPQHYDITQSGLPASQSWFPFAAASFGWQAGRLALASSYSRTVTGGGGLLGGFDSNTASATLRWRVASDWSLGSAANYVIYKTLTPILFSNSGGHSVSGTISLQRRIGQHYYAEIGYTRLHQSYGSIAVLSTFPDVNREYIIIGYQFKRPLGR